MNKTYLVTLTKSERALLEKRIIVGDAPALDLLHARILLKADDGSDGPAWTDADFATALETSTSTVGRIRRRFAEDGLEAALPGGPTCARPRRRAFFNQQVSFSEGWQHGEQAW